MQEYNRNCYTSQRAPEMVPTRPAAPEMVPTRPAAPEMVPRPPAVGEAPSPDGRVLSDLASSCLAYAAVVALRSLACGLAHKSSDVRTSRLLKSPCFVDATFRYSFVGLFFQQCSRIFFSCQSVRKCREY